MHRYVGSSHRVASYQGDLELVPLPFTCMLEFTGNGTVMHLLAHS